MCGGNLRIPNRIRRSSRDRQVMAKASVKPLNINEFQNVTSVSRETLGRLEAYLRLLEHWQKRLNLVGEASLQDPWRRHFLDSAQLLPLLPKNTRIVVDMGSGAGFPGLVLGVLGVPEVHLIESDAKKAAFLGEAARVTGVSAHIHRCRIAALAPFPADAVTARALAPLSRLLGEALPFLDLGAVGLFPKGRRVSEELTEAEKSWKMTIERFPSQSDRESVILRIRDVHRAKRYDPR